MAIGASLNDGKSGGGRILGPLESQGPSDALPLSYQWSFCSSSGSADGETMGNYFSIEAAPKDFMFLEDIEERRGTTRKYWLRYFGNFGCLGFVKHMFSSFSS